MRSPQGMLSPTALFRRIPVSKPAKRYQILTKYLPLTAERFIAAGNVSPRFWLVLVRLKEIEGGLKIARVHVVDRLA